jgi:hypothetical protein
MNSTAKCAPLVSPARRLITSLALALGWSLALGLLASFAATGIALAAPDPNALLAPLACGVSAVCALACGFLTRHRARLSPLLCGVLSGALLVALFWLMGALFPSDHAWASPIAWGLRGGMLVFSLLGASLGANLPKKKRRPTRRR